MRDDLHDILVTAEVELLAPVAFENHLRDLPAVGRVGSGDLPALHLGLPAFPMEIAAGARVLPQVDGVGLCALQRRDSPDYVRFPVFSQIAAYRVGYDLLRGPVGSGHNHFGVTIGIERRRGEGGAHSHGRHGEPALQPINLTGISAL